MIAAGPRVGVFGGSFDPVHNAHIALAQHALDQLALDEVIWVPAGQPWQKRRALAPVEHREAMVTLAIEGEPRFTLSRIETQRSGPSYTVDTVRVLDALRPGTRWHLLIGADQYAAFQTWHGWQELLGMVTLSVAGRDANAVATSLPALADAAVPPLPYQTVLLPAMAVSSTEIRARVACGESIDGLAPAAVARYIARHHLYRDNPLPRS